MVLSNSIHKTQTFSRGGNLTFLPSPNVTYLGNGSYRLNLNEVSHKAELGLQECLGIFSRER